MKTKRTIGFLALLFSLICIITVIPVSADDGFADEYYRLYDLAGLLTETEYNVILAALDEVSLRQHMDVARDSGRP